MVGAESLGGARGSLDQFAQIEQHGPFQICAEPEIMQALDALLQAFVEQHRMKVPGKAYTPCYALKKQ